MAAPGKCLLVTGPPVSSCPDDRRALDAHFFALMFLSYLCEQGVGKTTLITRVFDCLRASNPNLTVQGFYTRADALSLSPPFLLLLLPIFVVS